ncbi:MAG: TerB family tellurite resistance protein, partial [Gammaproteobacteria bacterium]|nr:TerB family tellurite resistance protein [Gammaproteobacteria bacterium]
TRQTVYFVATFSMLAKLARADGRVTEQEIAVIDRVMRENLRLPAQARELAIRIFNEAKQSSQTFEDFARQFYTEFSRAPEVLASVLDLLLLVAMSDGNLHAAEERLLKSAARIFGIDHQYEQLKSRYVPAAADNIDRCYKILGAEPGDSLAVIKKKYRKLAMDFHPDRVQSQGMPPELAQAAEERFKEIRHAWDILEKHLGSKA